MILSAVISPRHQDYLNSCRPHKCIDCGKERLVCYKRDIPQNLRCKSCAIKIGHSRGLRNNLKGGDKSYSWTGGTHKASGGYMHVWVDKTSPFFPMADVHNYVLEHRLIMAKHIGRCLHGSEIVHHKNGVKTDNRILNLEITNPLQNFAYEKMCRKCELRRRVTLLEAELARMSKQLQERLAV